MDKKKEIKIDRTIIKRLIISIFSAILVFVVLEHLGEFTYKAYGGEQPYKTPLTSIIYTTLLGNEVVEDGMGFTYSEVYKGGKFHTYLNKFPFYLKGLLADWIYVFSLILLIFGLLFIRSNYKFKVQ